MSDGPRGTRLGGFATTVSLVVDLVDGFTGRGPLGDPRVALEGSDATPIRNPSGYRVFTGLPAGPVTVVVDGGERYLDERRTGVGAIDLSDPGTDVDPSDPSTLPLVRIELAPSPAYRFPAGSTRVRGSVSDPDGDPVAGADLSVRDHGASTRTDANGEFVLFFADVTGADVRTAGDRTLITVDGGDPTIDVDHPGLGTTSATVAVEEGTLTVHDIGYPPP